jgi:hypothetical protein
VYAIKSRLLFETAAICFAAETVIMHRCRQHRPATIVFRFPAFALLLVPVTIATIANADDVQPLHEQIDRLIADRTPNYDNLAAPLADDAEFLRRVSLDLTGMIPTTAAARQFLADADPEKRAKLIDQLLAGPEYARHMQRVFDVILMRRLPSKNVPAAVWETFLRNAFAENKSWDQITREILGADGVDKDNRGPARFYLDRNGEVNEITRDIGRVFLGANLECAQCHDHPEYDDWKQEHYYGISAFLVRSSLFTDPKSKTTMLAEKADGEVKFESVFEVRDKKSKGPKSTLPRLFDEVALTEPEFKKGDEYEVKPAKDVRPIPKYSRRAQLPAAITAPGNERFARTAANRLWAIMLGRGLIEPVDMDHAGNPPSHPELLDLLTEELAAHQFDIKWFLREVALSQTYQRSSHRAPLDSTVAAVNPVVARSPDRATESTEGLPDSSLRPVVAPGAGSGDPRTTEGHSATEMGEAAFAQAILKPLSPAQFAWAILEAVGEADVQRQSLGAKSNEENLYKRLDNFESTFVNRFAGTPGEPPAGFESTVDQVLFLSNDNFVRNLIKPKTGNLADRLGKLPADNPQAIAEELFLSVLTRPPSEEDTRDVTDYLADRTADARSAAIVELVWALVTSAEFRFCH